MEAACSNSGTGGLKEVLMSPGQLPPLPPPTARLLPLHGTAATEEAGRWRHCRGRSCLPGSHGLGRGQQLVANLVQLSLDCRGWERPWEGTATVGVRPPERSQQHARLTPLCWLRRFCAPKRIPSVLPPSMLPRRRHRHPASGYLCRRLSWPHALCHPSRERPRRVALFTAALTRQVDLRGAVLDDEASNERVVHHGLELDVLAARQLLRGALSSVRLGAQCVRQAPRRRIMRHEGRDCATDPPLRFLHAAGRCLRSAASTIDPHSPPHLQLLGNQELLLLLQLHGAAQRGHLQQEVERAAAALLAPYLCQPVDPWPPSRGPSIWADTSSAADKAPCPSNQHPPACQSDRSSWPRSSQ